MTLEIIRAKRRGVATIKWTLCLEEKIKAMDPEDFVVDIGGPPSQIRIRILDRTALSSKGQLELSPGADGGFVLTTSI